MVQFQAKFQMIPRDELKAKLNLFEVRMRWVFRTLQLLAFVSNCIATAFSIVRCHTTGEHIQEVLVYQLTFICTILFYFDLVRTLKSKYFVMYKSHLTRIRLLLAGILVALSLQISMTVLNMNNKSSFLSGIPEVIVHSIINILPIFTYVISHGSLEDCFDCFNRSK